MNKMVKYYYWKFLSKERDTYDLPPIETFIDLMESGYKHKTSRKSKKIVRLILNKEAIRLCKKCISGKDIGKLNDLYKRGGEYRRFIDSLGRQVRKKIINYRK